jgi:hypothetical protein
MSYPGGGIPITPNSAPTPVSRAPLSANTKGKGRAIPSPLGTGNGNGTGTGTTAPGATQNPLAGNIGSSSNGAARQSDRRWIGGVQVETRCVISLLDNELAANDRHRYSGVDTLDEPITTTMVCTVLLFPLDFI